MKKNIFSVLALGAILIACGGNEAADNSSETAKPVVVEAKPQLPLREPKALDYFVNKIMEDSVWYNGLQDKAEKRGISVDEMLQVDAKFLQNEDNKIISVENDIIKNKEWFEAVKKKADAAGIELDEQIRKEAYFMVSQQKKAK